MTVIAANAGRYPVSAQCEILGVPRSTYYAMRGRAEPAEAPDPAAEEVAAAFEESRGRYGARKIKASLARRGIVLSNAAIDELLDVFEIKRSLSAKGCPYDNSVDESTNKILKAEFVYRDRFSTLRELQAKLSDYVNWYNNFRLHSTLGYMSPVEFRLAGLTL